MAPTVTQCPGPSLTPRADDADQISAGVVAAPLADEGALPLVDSVQIDRFGAELVGE